MTNANSRIAIIGAGPLGLMAALAFAKTGAKVDLIGPQTNQDGRTTAILSDGLNLFDELGIWGDLEPKTAPLEVMRLVDGSKRLIRAPEIAFKALEVALEAFGHNVKNADLLDTLMAAVDASNEVSWHQQTLKTCDLSAASRATLQLADGTELMCDLVIGADGRNSLIRENAGIKANRWNYPQTALVLNLSHTRPHENISTEFHTETGPFTFVPLPDNKSSLVWVEKPEVAEKLLATDRAELARMIEEKSQFLLGDITIERDPMAYPLSGLSAQDFGNGRAILIGESAHVFPPIGAQGMNLGIRDLRDALKYCAPQKLKQNADEAVSKYAQARQLDIKMRTTAVDLLNRSLLTGILPVHLAKGIGLYVLDKLPFARKSLMAMGLGTAKAS